MSLTLLKRRTTPFVITNLGRYGIGTKVANVSAGANPAANAWPLANLGLFYPIAIDHPVVVDKLGWANTTTTTTTNVCIAVYDELWNRLVTTTPTAMQGAAGAQFVTVTNTLLLPDTRYYLAMSASATTNVLSVGLGVGRIPVMGILEQTAVGTLPDPAAPSVTSRANLFYCAIMPKVI